jgi:hypothetical protein
MTAGGKKGPAKRLLRTREKTHRGPAAGAVDRAGVRQHKLVMCDDPSLRVFVPAGVLASGAAILLAPPTACADGFDAVWFMTRVGEWEAHPGWSAAMLAALMAANYFLNLVIVGLPAALTLKVPVTTLLPGLIGFTLLGQVADRIGAVAALAMALPIADSFGVNGERSLALGFLAGIGLNFLFSGLAVGLLALWFLQRRWGVSRTPARAIAVVAAVVTNPAWAMGLWFLPHAS